MSLRCKLRQGSPSRSVCPDSAAGCKTCRLRRVWCFPTDNRDALHLRPLKNCALSSHGQVKKSLFYWFLIVLIQSLIVGNGAGEPPHVVSAQLINRFFPALEKRPNKMPSVNKSYTRTLSDFHLLIHKYNVPSFALRIRLGSWSLFTVRV